MTYRYPYASRLNSFKSRPDLFDWKYGPEDMRDLVRRAGRVPDLQAIVLNFPEHFQHQTPSELQNAAHEAGLEIAGINMRFPEPEYDRGAFTHPEAKKRRDAICLTQQAADLCRQLGGRDLVIWPSSDGFDYPFQMDYAQAWDWEVDGVRQVASYAPDLRISIEFKPAEPRRHSLLNSVGSTLLAIQECHAPNLGLTLDFCHMLMAGENPAHSAALCLRQERLFGLHLNDGYGPLDDGLLVGSANPIQTLELLEQIVHSSYDGVIYFDTFPVREDPVAECSTNIHRVENMLAWIEHLDGNGLLASRSQQDGLGVMTQLWEAVFRP